MPQSTHLPVACIFSGWLYGSLRGKAGLFPSEYIKPLARHELPQKVGANVLYTMYIYKFCLLL